MGGGGGVRMDGSVFDFSICLLTLICFVLALMKFVKMNVFSTIFTLKVLKWTSHLNKTTQYSSLYSWNFFFSNFVC